MGAGEERGSQAGSVGRAHAHSPGLARAGETRLVAQGLQRFAMLPADGANHGHLVWAVTSPSGTRVALKRSFVAP
jgi:hypothetical protein